MSVAYWPVACDFEVQEKDGRIVVGPETEKACRHTFKQIQELPEDMEFYILPSAGISPKGIFDGEIMSLTMCNFFVYELGISDERIEPLQGKTFDTEGEAREVARFLKENRDIKTLVICVKWWHAIRAYNWVLLYLKKYRIFDVEIIVEACGTDVSPPVIEKEFWWATPYNLIRMWFVRIMP